MAAALNRGARLTDLRELLQLTQNELAQAADVPQSTISAVEKGDRELTPAMVNAVCAGVRVPLTFFDFPAVRVDPAAVHFRKMSSAGVKSTKSALRYFEELQRITNLLMEEWSGKRTELKPVTGHIDGADIEEIAVEVRDELGISQDQPVKHVMRAVERSGIAVAPLVRLGMDHPAFDGHSGMSRARSESALVMFAPSTAGDRQRFTVAHELGHLKLHFARTVDDERTREKEAHRFAGALLYPRHVAKRDISESLSLNGYARIKARWGIAIQALIQRGRDLRLISTDRHRSLMIQVSSRGWRKNEPVEVGVEHPILLWRLLSSKYGDAPYMAASHDFGIAPELLELWIPNRAAKRGPTGDVVPLFSTGQRSTRNPRQRH
ncbi:XRE family transcriptional regulator [Mycobacterium vicinigordonae]|uniref:ImmA/IrrE family metallo-endopeptidase n=1 Tax=Mycobacterium vicinigordonae TaxID=1719132 RepID=A0A7D6HZR1_9MYCO|nr:XRE family transcriptional regulator [Mycobacterium vicinigordonae]QLL08855.1 ImmA/IrrE family metallo-endopeptidase [Mycobacterium vicinigordonae]